MDERVSAVMAGLFWQREARTSPEGADFYKLRVAYSNSLDRTVSNQIAGELCVKKFMLKHTH